MTFLSIRILVVPLWMTVIRISSDCKDFPLQIL